MHKTKQNIHHPVYKMAAARHVAAAAGVFTRIKPEVYRASDKLIVGDEFLSFLVIKMRTPSQNDIISVPTNSFGSDLIETNDLLFEVCPQTKLCRNKWPQDTGNNIQMYMKLLSQI